MRLLLALLSPLAITLVCFWTHNDARAQNTASSRAPIYTRHTAFTLPFHLTKAARPEQEAVEIELLVSENQGQSWRSAEKAKPDARAFRFRATNDGEYWFCVKTKDASGQIRPVGPCQPEAMVIVDSTPPVLHTTAMRLDDGQVRLRWEIADTHLDMARFKATVREGEAVSVRDIPLPSPAEQLGKPVAVGEATFAPASRERLEIRILAYDLAGNMAESTNSLEALPPLSRASAREGATPAESPPPQTQRQAADPFATAPPFGGAAWGATRWPAEGTSSTPWSAGPPDTPSGQRDAVFRDPRQDAELTPVNTAQRPISAELPVWAVRARQFEVSYHLGQIPSNRQRTATLWGTLDGGQSWRELGVDRTGSGTVAVEVPEEGLYGLRIVRQTQGGIVEFPPARGDQPELMVRVDVTPPECRLTRADQYGEELVIAWEATDADLASRPVTLKCRTAPEDAWITLGANLENSGRLAFRVRDVFDATWPRELYLQLEVRDRAGNVAVDTAEGPLRLTRPASKGQIQEVRPR